MEIKTVSIDSVIVYFEQIISEEVLDQVQQSNRVIQGLNGIIDTIPSYASILVTYNIKIHNHKSIKNLLQKALESFNSLGLRSSKNIIEIPTDYRCNLDLKRVGDYNNLTIDEVVTLHTQTLYRVYAIGFMVGFGYLAQVNPKIATPRLESPRAKVPKGSVAIADTQTAIYPQHSAGGWNIIGHTDFSEFERFEIGDRVRFVAI